MKSFKFCPRCGSAKFNGESCFHQVCADCGFIYYHNAAPGVAALILDGTGRALIGVRAYDPFKGSLAMPGGFVDQSEDAASALAREVMEETGLSVTGARFLASFTDTYEYGGFVRPVLSLLFRAEVNDFSTLKAGDDMRDLRFMAKEEVNLADFAMGSARMETELWLNGAG